MGLLLTLAASGWPGCADHAELKGEASCQTVIVALHRKGLRRIPAVPSRQAPRDFTGGPDIALGQALDIRYPSAAKLGIERRL